MLEQGDALSVSYWGTDGKITYFDYIPENYPRFEAGTWDSTKEFIKRTTEMVEKEGWEIQDDRRDEIDTGPWH